MSIASLLILVLAGSASSEDGALAAGPTFAVRYRAGPECPNQETFEAAIVARAPHARKVSDEALAQVRFQAELALHGEKPRLRAELADGTSQDREIAADGCVEAMQSMALIAAMILEAQPATPPTKTSETAEAIPLPPTEVRAPATRATMDAAEPIHSVSKRRSRLTTGLSAVAEGAAAPSPAYGIAGSAQLGQISERGLAPSLRMSLLVAQAAREKTSAGDARFRLMLARAHGCVWRFTTSPLELRPCLVLEGGALFGRGINARNQRRQTMPWLGVGIGALGRMELSGPLALDADVGARLLTVRDRFAFGDSIEAHQVPVIAWNFSIGLTWRVW